MYRQIFTPTPSNRTFTVPEEFIGKPTEVIVFFTSEGIISQAESGQSVENLFKRFDGLTFNSGGNFKFNRDEATDYE